MSAQPRKRSTPARKRKVRAPKLPTPARTLIRAADVAPEELEFLWLDRIPKGTITLIGGRPGQGKSLFTTYLAAQVTQAGGAVIMSNPEDALASVKVPRLLAAGADTRLVHFWPGKLRLPQDVDDLEELVAFHGVKLVTIDPIAKHVASKDPNTALEPLVAMAERTGVAVVGVHHLVKRLPKDAHPQEAFGGASGGWLGTVRFAHVLGPAGPGEPETRYMAVAKSNHADDSIAACEFYLDGEAEVNLPTGGVAETARLVFQNSTAGVDAAAVVQYRGNGYKDGGSSEKKAVASEFLTLLLMNGPCPAQELFDKAAEVGVSKMTIRRAAEELGIEKQRIGFGPGSYLVWSLPASHPLASVGAPSVEEGDELDEALRQILADADVDAEDEDGDEDDGDA